MSVYPNPADVYFTLVPKSGNTEKIQVRVTTATGSVIEVKQNIAPGTLIKIGHQYKPGIYYAEVIQGKEKKILKLIKTE